MVDRASLVGFSRQRIGKLIFGERAYDPQPDITTLELARIVEMVAHGTATASLGVVWDWDDYIARHGLDRHFPKKGEGA